ncbi:MAG: DUF1292 domain-containing protein [Clostridia bacterium]|nr:DUF1292 domain-containing protein [Clostridia bacterium]
MSNNELSTIEKILDEDNIDNIFLYDDEDNEIEFEQVAVIPLDEKVYVLLSPVEELDGISPDEGIVFLIDEVDDEDVLTVVDDDALIDRVFSEYEQLLEEEGVI